VRVLVGLWLVFWGGLLGAAMGAIVGTATGDFLALVFAVVGWVLGPAGTAIALVVGAIRRRRAPRV
jgi:hypothetical protein